MKLSEARKIRAFEWSIEHSGAFFVYLIFIWGMAFIRRDYLWITGDDPNLLEQSILMTKGFTPNVDYLSGYPGLSIQLQAIIVDLFGPLPISEHIYSAFLATLLGVVIFNFGKSIRPFWLLLFLVFIYSQGLFLNPTPNPGFLFAIVFIIGLKKSIDFLSEFKTVDALWAGVFFGIAFIAKQYGVFGPIAFFIASLLYLKIIPAIRKGLFVMILFVISLIFSLNMFPLSMLKDGSLTDFAVNLFVFVFPILVGVFFVLKDKSLNVNVNRIDLSRFFLANTAMIIGYFGVISLYFLNLYGAANIADSVQEIMFLVPRMINNQEILSIVVSKHNSLYIAMALMVLSLPFILDIYILEKYKYLIEFTIAFMVLGLLLMHANLSASLFLTIFYVILLGMTNWVRKNNGSLNALMSIELGCLPFLLILVPYPNYSYHIPILIFFTLIFYSKLSDMFPNKYRYFSVMKRIDARICWTLETLPCFILLLFLVGIVFHEANEINEYKLYSFGQFHFRSGDSEWENVINEALQVKDGMGKCASNGCRYLLLTLPEPLNYKSIIEKPL